MVTEKQLASLEQLSIGQLWSAEDGPLETATTHIDDITTGLIALPEYSMDPESSRMTPEQGEAMRWLFRAVAGDRRFHASRQYDGLIRDVTTTVHRLRDGGEKASAEVVENVVRELFQKRDQRYRKNARDLGRLIAESEPIYVGYGTARFPSFRIAQLEDIGVRAVRGGGKFAVSVVRGQDGTVGLGPSGYPVRKALYMAAESD